MRDTNRSSVRRLGATVGLLQLFGVLLLAAVLGLAGCSSHADPAAGAPPTATVVLAAEPTLFTVDRAEQFPLTAAVEHSTTSELVVTGAVTPDISRNLPVISLASGRVVAIHARLGDTVKQGQLLLSIRTHDATAAFPPHRKPVPHAPL